MRKLMDGQFDPRRFFEDLLLSIIALGVRVLLARLGRRRAKTTTRR